MVGNTLDSSAAPDAADPDAWELTDDNIAGGFSWENEPGLVRDDGGGLIYPYQFRSESIICQLGITPDQAYSALEFVGEHDTDYVKNSGWRKVAERCNVPLTGFGKYATSADAQRELWNRYGESKDFGYSPAQLLNSFLLEDGEVLPEQFIRPWNNRPSDKYDNTMLAEDHIRIVCKPDEDGTMSLYFDDVDQHTNTDMDTDMVANPQPVGEYISENGENGVEDLAKCITAGFLRTVALADVKTFAHYRRDANGENNVVETPYFEQRISGYRNIDNLILLPNRGVSSQDNERCVRVVNIITHGRHYTDEQKESADRYTDQSPRKISVLIYYNQGRAIGFALDSEIISEEDVHAAQSIPGSIITQ